ncbi:MAG: DNA polymerase III subunit beta [Blastocatellia bacterium]|jgi:DNA polymerase-3 subunit beta
MKFSIGRQSFQKELGLLQGVVEKKSTIPILSNLMIEVQAGGVELKATDLDLSISTFCEADVAETGSLCLAAKKLFEIVRAMPEAEIELKSGEKEQLTLSCERSRFKLLGVPTDNFPRIKQMPESAISFPAEIFRTFIGRTIFSITNEESRYALNGAKFEFGEETLRMVATDGHRLSFIEKPFHNPGERLDLLIPKKTLTEVARLSAESDDQIEIAFQDQHLFFRFGKRILSSRTLSGQFPNYEMVLPRENNHRFVIESHRLAAALRRVALVADDRSHAIRFELKENLVSITAASESVGEAGEELAVQYDGPPIAIGFNAQYLLDLFAVISEGELVLEFKDGSSQVQIRPNNEADYDFRYIVMPMRI